MPTMARIPLTRRAQRRLSWLAIVLFIYLSVWYIILPPDSPIRLAILFNTSRFKNSIRLDRDAWLSEEPAPFPLDLTEDVGYLVKTGFGTRHRVPEQMRAFEKTGGLLGQEGKDFVVVGDWTCMNETDRGVMGVEVRDAIRMVMEGKLGRKFENEQRFVKYRQLQDAVEQQDEKKANTLGKNFGWELDALKFMLGMDLLNDQMPTKKWYIILDDDTYLVRPSLHLLLSHLNPQQPYYIGNAVGDYRGRFAHGGSAVILSSEAMRRLFNAPHVVAQAYRDSLRETWGDRLVATTLQKVGVYLDERYNHHFNGEHPSATRILADRFCSPIVSFHNLRHLGDMDGIAEVLAKAQKPLLWGQIWDLFAKMSLTTFAKQDLHVDMDLVGEADGRTRQLSGVSSAAACKAQCHQERDRCLAWRFTQTGGKCTLSPWMAPGKALRGSTSGVNWPSVEGLLRQCP